MQTHHMGDTCSHENPQNKHQHKGTAWLLNQRVAWEFVLLNLPLNWQKSTQQWNLGAKQVSWSEWQHDSPGVGLSKQHRSVPRASQLKQQVLWQQSLNSFSWWAAVVTQCCPVRIPQQASRQVQAERGKPFTSSACCRHDFTCSTPNSVVAFSENNYSQWAFSIVWAIMKQRPFLPAANDLFTNYNIIPCTNPKNF